MPFRAAIGSRRAMSGGASSGGGRTRSVRRLADLAQEALEVERREADQRLRSVGLADERVRDALRAEREGARRQRQPLVTDVDRELALEDVEPLVLVRMDMPRRAFAGADGHFEQAELAVRVVAADLHDLEHPEEPVRLALVLAEHEAAPAPAGSVPSSLLAPSVDVLRCATVVERTFSYAIVTVKPRRPSDCGRGACTSRASSRSRTCSTASSNATPASRSGGTTCSSISRTSRTACR